MPALDDLPLPALLAEIVGDGAIERLAVASHEEDTAGLGDPTTESIVAPGMRGRAVMRARQAGVLAGLPLLPRLMPEIEIETALADGDRCDGGAVLAEVRGGLGRLLTLERPALNLLGWLSGIATVTRRYVDAVEGTPARICATRKTTPGVRGLEKYAVRCGGGELHRMGLWDALLYKDNHLAAIPPGAVAERLTAAIDRARRDRELRFVEVEVDTLEQLDAVLGMERGLVDIVLLDNMTPEALAEAVRRRDARAPHVGLEASGGVTLGTVHAIAQTGVDRISVGAITHSAPWLDIGMDLLS